MKSEAEVKAEAKESEMYNFGNVYVTLVAHPTAISNAV